MLFWGINTVVDITTNSGDECLFSWISTTLILLLGYFIIESKTFRNKDKLIYNITFFVNAGISILILFYFFSSDLFRLFYNKFYDYDVFLPGLQYGIYFLTWIGLILVLLIIKLIILGVKKIRNSKALKE